MTYHCTAKGTFLRPSGPARDPDRKHLHIALTDPCKSGLHLIVPICSVSTRHYDKTCVIQPGEHDFIKAESYVDYRMATTMLSSQISKCVAAGLYIERANVSDDLFARICAGVNASPEITPSMKRAFQNWPN